MGLFDKLFGKKKPEAPPQPAPRPAPEPKKTAPESGVKTIAGIEYVIPEPVKALEYFRSFTYEEKEKMINANPLTEKYRRETQQQTTSMNTITWEQFKTRSKGTFIALDLETTGLDNDGDDIVEIGAVKVVKGQIADTYHQYVNPNRSMPADAQEVNHITDDMLVGKPFIFEVLPDLLDFVGTNIIVAHNATFDFGFIAQACMRDRFIIPRKWFDSMDLDEVWPGLKNRKMQTFLDAAGITNKKAHSADGDAEALAHLVIMSLNKE